MIENSFVNVESNGKIVTVEFWEDDALAEGPAKFPANYASFAAIIQYVNTQLNTHRLGLAEKMQIQRLLGSPWLVMKLRFDWNKLKPLVGKTKRIW